MAKLVNDPLELVSEMLEGFVAVHPHTHLLATHGVVVRADAPVAGKVAIVSGGGSGHEPAHAGYVGRGMLSAAVAGEVFTSPSAEAVLAAIRAVDAGRGVLLLIKNYMGDRLHFGEACERARDEGRRVRVVVVSDDVAFAQSLPRADCRGIAGTVLVHKVAGAAAESGLSLDEVARVAQRTADHIDTIGIALQGATLPGAAVAGFDVPPGTVAVGLGIHGEPGIDSAAHAPCDAIVEHLLARLERNSPVVSGERVVLMVNSLGATTPMELNVVARAALAELRRRGCTVERAYVGTFLTALDMAGVSLSLLRNVDGATLARLDLDTDASAWPRGVTAPPDMAVASQRCGVERARPDPMARPVVGLLVDALADAAAEIGELDRIAGDGDLGTSLLRFSHAVNADLSDLDRMDAPTLLDRLAISSSERMAGTSGALYSAALRAAAHRLSDAKDPLVPTVGEWAAAFCAAVDAISRAGGACPGDRTMVDALAPAAVAFMAAADEGASIQRAVSAAARAAEAGAASTTTMVPRRGRAAHLAESSAGHVDAGAQAAAIWLKALEAASSR